MDGTRISRDELKARWAFDELRTRRWAGAFASPSPERVRTSVDFADLTRGERLPLVWMIEVCRKNLVAELRRHGSYRCESWTKEQVGRTFTVPRMAPNRKENIPFLWFLACPRFAEPWEPRVEADQIPFDAPFVQTEPAIVLPHDATQILVEGYLRAALFRRSRGPDARLLVWVPGA